MKTPDTDTERMAQRDGFAAAALIGILATHGINRHGMDDYAIASSAFSLAEAMMDVRSKRPLP